MTIFVWLLSFLLLFGSALSAEATAIVDDRGRTITLTAAPERLISLYGGLTEILAALGLASKVVARIQGDDTVPEVPMVGTHLQPNVEMILALRPDLVLQGGVAKGLPALARLEAEGVPVAMFAPRNFPGLFRTIQRLGLITGRQDEAAAVIRNMQEKLQEVARRVAGRRPPRVFFEVRYPQLLGAGADGIVHDIIRHAGGQNILTTAKKLVPVSLEHLLQENPEVYVIQRGPMNKSPGDIYTRPFFQELTAVKNKRVLMVDESLFSRPGPRAADAVVQLARFLHPEAF